MPLNVITSDGLGQLNLDYGDSENNRKKITGSIFQINHNLTQREAITWNQKALTPSSSSLTLITTKAVSAVATSTATLSASITPVQSSSASSYLQAQDTLAPSGASTPTSLPAKSSSSSSSARIASITLGTVLGVVFATALYMLWIRKRRQKRTSTQTASVQSATPLSVHARTSEIQEVDAEVAPIEMRGQDSRWELDGRRR